jgi:CheY-like chemotaxis protein
VLTTETLMTEPNKQTTRILVADDEQGICSLLKRLLESKICNCEVALASNASEASRMFREAFGEGRPYQLVITDLRMPNGGHAFSKIGGICLLEDIRQIGHSPLVYVFSATVADCDEYIAKFHFVKRLLEKPCDVLTLAAYVEEDLVKYAGRTLSSGQA